VPENFFARPSHRWLALCEVPTLLDLFVSSYGSHSALLHNEGNGLFTRIINGAIYQSIAKSTGGAWADYDNDGFLDLFVPTIAGTTAFPLP